MNRLYKIKLNIFCLFLIGSIVPVFAQDEFISEFTNEFKTEQGNFFHLATLMEFGSEDNFLFDDKIHDETTYIRLSPALKMQAQFDRQLFSLSANSHHWQFQNFDNDKYSDYLFAPRYRYKLDDNKTLFVDSSIKSSYQRRGTGLSIGNGKILDKGDELEIFTISGGYLFGKQASVAKIKTEIGHKNTEFLTRRAVTDVFDKKVEFLDLSFDYLISGLTYYTSSFKFETVAFRNNPILDKNKLIGLAGIKWQATEITRLELLLGYQKVNFKEDTFEDDSSFSWRFNGEWSPVGTMKFLFQSERTFEEANRLQARYSLVDLHKVKGTYAFSDIFNVLTEIGYRSEQIFYTDRLEINDYLYSKLQLNYTRNEWLSFFVKYEYNSLDSTVEVYNHQKNGISLGINVNI